MTTQLVAVYGAEQMEVVSQGALGPQGLQGPPGLPGAGTGVGAQVGTGSPEGVVGAAVGTEYIDTAATNGAVKWIKATGTGVSGWRVVFGDTGLRAITTWDTAGVITGQALDATSWVPRAGTAGGIWVRRTANVIELNITNLSRLNGTANGVWAAGYALPTGLRPKKDVQRTSILSGTTVQGIIFFTNGTIGRAGGNYSGTHGDISQETFIATAFDSPPWPVGALPGVAA